MRNRTREFLDKIGNMKFKLENEHGEYEVGIEVTENEDDIRITIDTNSKLGHNCIFNETYDYNEEIEVELLEDLHEQNLKDIKDYIYNLIQETASDIADSIEMFLEENTYHNIETISLNTNLSELEDEIEKRGYKVKKNGSMWTITK